MKLFEIKKKLINHFMKNGKKTVSEKILLNSFKELQKVSFKRPEELFKNALINAIPIFKIHKSENKKQKKIKETPFFLVSNKSRISLAIKLITESLKNKKQNICFQSLNKEILLSNQQKGNSIETKNGLQKKVILNKRYFRFYRWR
jgi:small subunit ribosomal protein S7